MDGERSSITTRLSGASVKGRITGTLNEPTQINNQISDTLTQLEFDPSYVVWGDEWGRTWAAGGRTDPVVRTTGVTYQWYATVQGQMLRGLASVSGRR